jgi:sulfate adenylyltransferase subunit 2
LRITGFEVTGAEPVRQSLTALQGCSRDNEIRREIFKTVIGPNDIGQNDIGPNDMNLSYLRQLESESIYIMREVAATFEKPVMLYSGGKDSAVMLHLAQKAFFPAAPPFPLLHIDTTWKFRELIEFRDQMAAECGMDLIVHTNPEGVHQGINPFDHDAGLYTRIMKTEALKQALDAHEFDAAFGGARRDEEKSRAKERIFSLRGRNHRWDPKAQRAELWRLYNTRLHRGESMRVFPLSNWTEFDVWLYILAEKIPVPALYYSAVRPVIERDGQLIMVDDDRLKLAPGEELRQRRVRFRTLGCYPLTAAVESEAETIEEVILETMAMDTSERFGRLIDHGASSSFERMKQDGYF